MTAKIRGIAFSAVDKYDSRTRLMKNAKNPMVPTEAVAINKTRNIVSICASPVLNHQDIFAVSHRQHCFHAHSENSCKRSLYFDVFVVPKTKHKINCKFSALQIS